MTGPKPDPTVAARQWLNDYEEREDHDTDFSIDLKERAYHVILDLLSLIRSRRP
jgi:hypothetical protein